MPRFKKRFIRSGKFYVYIIECADGTYYTGYTPHIKKRFKLHNAGKGARYTRQHGPVKLVWSKSYKYFKPAFKKEIAIKRLKRSEKERLIDGYTK